MSTLSETLRQLVRDELRALVQQELTNATAGAEPAQEVWASDPPGLRRPWSDDVFARLEAYAAAHADAGETRTVGDWLHLIGEPNPLERATPGDKRAFSMGMKRIGFHLGRSAANVILSKNGQNVWTWLTAAHGKRK